MAIKFLRKPIRMTFYDLLRKGKSMYSTEEGVEMTIGSLHSGSTFSGTITLQEDDMDDLNKMFEAGLQPVFWISPIWDTRRDEKDVSADNDSG